MWTGGFATFFVCPQWFALSLRARNGLPEFEKFGWLQTIF
jgi:hypothetical protein